MSKGSRKREAAILRREEEARQQALAKQQRKKNAILATVVAVVTAAAVTVVGLSVWMKTPAYRMHHAVAAKSDDFEITQAMMTYFTASTYMNFASQYEDDLDMLELDTEKPLKDQACYYDRSITWLDYFVNTTKNSIQWMLGFAEQAKADGRELGEDEKKTIEETLENTKPTNFGEHVTLDDVRACLELYYLAAVQEEYVQSTLDCTDEEIESWADEHNQELLVADYTYYSLPYGTGAYYADKDTALALANKMKEATLADFTATAKAELLQRKVYTEDALKEQYTSNYERTGYAYKEGDGFSAWLFHADTKAGDGFIKETDSGITVYKCMTPAVRDDEPTVNVRHILVSEETCETLEKAKEKADAILSEWKSGDATSATFGELAAQYSEDGNAADGGLYTGVYQGQMVETFNDWCFDKTRKEGDTGIVETDYGYHVMYFEGSQPMWRTTAEQMLMNEQYDALFDGYLDTHHVTIHDDVLKEITF